MQDQSVISAFQRVLRGFSFKIEGSSFPEVFAQKRYLKKMQEPDESVTKRLKQECWERYLATDRSLGDNLLLPPRMWYKARILIHKWMKAYRASDSVDFPTGSSFITTRGRNGVAQYLSNNAWSCTPSARSDFLDIVMKHKALKRALKKRFHQEIERRGYDIREVNSFLYHRMPSTREILDAKLDIVCHETQGSRFSSVEKNNEKRRPINIEPFGNLLVQRCIGNGLRRVLRLQGLDLNNAASWHGVVIRNPIYATIDMTDCSDTISIALCRFLFPPWFFKKLMRARSSFLYGPDGQFHQLDKISSMGNGFTFELMTMILYALCQSYDQCSSVFGDDVIIRKTHAKALIADLEAVGFKPNLSKTFLDGPFRESCGMNFHDEYGYIESFDFLWPTSIHDCIVLYNKAKVLSGKYPSFLPLERSLATHIPSALRGGTGKFRVKRTFGPEEIQSVSSCFWVGGHSNLASCAAKYEKLIRKSYQLTESVSIRFHYGFEFEPSLCQPQRRSLTASNWDLYELYLFSGRVAKDVIRGKGVWRRKLFVCINGESSRFSPSQLTAERIE